MRILGVETSCDDTGIAIYDEKQGLLINKITSQQKIHNIYGGIVPELAARNHIQKTIKLIKKTLDKLKQKPTDIDGIAYTAGPGLINSLLVGASISYALSYAWKIPIIPINHIEGHLLSVMIKKKNKPIFPCVALIISGANTQLIAAESIGKYKILGKSIDDAVGETFDKIAKLLGLNYPGGAMLSKLAQYGKNKCYYFPRPMINKGLNFSFSGLKTHVTKIIKSNNNNFQNRANIAKAFEEAVIDTIITKSQRALKITGFKKLIIAGGVSANKILRQQIKKKIYIKNQQVFYPNIRFCTDNGAMIAYAGIIKWKTKKKNNLKILVSPKWAIGEPLKN